MEVKLPSGLKVIDDSAFGGCSALAEISFPTSLEIIGNNAFCDCSSLTKLDLPRNLLRIGISAFSGCKKLKRVNFNDAVRCIDYEAFSGCRCIEEAVLPCDLQLLGIRAFQNCFELKRVAFSPTQKQRTLSNLGWGDSFRGCKNIEVFYAPRSQLTDNDSKALLNLPDVAPLRAATLTVPLAQSYYWTTANHAKCSPAAAKATHTVLLVASRLLRDQEAMHLPIELWHAILNMLCRAELGEQKRLR